MEGEQPSRAILPNETHRQERVHDSSIRFRTPRRTTAGNKNSTPPLPFFPSSLASALHYPGCFPRSRSRSPASSCSPSVPAQMEEQASRSRCFGPIQRLLQHRPPRLLLHFRSARRSSRSEYGYLRSLDSSPTDDPSPQRTTQTSKRSSSQPRASASWAMRTARGE